MMSSRKELKERRRQERAEAEEQAVAAVRRRRRTRLGAVAAGVTAAVAVGVAFAVLGGTGDDADKAFGAKPDGLSDRLEKARLTLGADHFHPTVRVVVDGQAIPIPSDIGQGSGGVHAPLHMHPGDEKLHAEGLTEGRFTLAQFMEVWGVPLSATRLGPYRADARRKVIVFAEAKGETRFQVVPDFDRLQLRDGEQVYVFYGTRAESPIRL